MGAGQQLQVGGRGCPATQVRHEMRGNEGGMGHSLPVLEEEKKMAAHQARLTPSPLALSPALHGRRCPLDPARRQGGGGGVLEEEKKMAAHQARLTPSPLALSPTLHGRRCPLDPARRQGEGGGVLADGRVPADVM
jgi:hypothetical protein